MSIQNVQAFEAVCDECGRRHGHLSEERPDLVSVVRRDGWRADPVYGGGVKFRCPECQKKPTAEQAAS